MAKDHGNQIKNDAQYEAMRAKGMSKEKAARIANANAQEGGNPASERGGHASKYETRSKSDLYDEARKIGIEGRSRMSKDELIDALRHH